MIDRVPSILMLTWNRSEYFERTIAHLLGDASDFRLYMWDNGSGDGVRERIAELKDERIVQRFYSPENVGQAKPWHWFLDVCRGDIAGKLDDDIIGEHGWMARFAASLADNKRIGTLGAWVYLPEEWDEAVAGHKIRTVGSVTMFCNPWVPGGIFLGRKRTLTRFTSWDPTRWGTPLDQLAMSRRGFINGYLLPMSFAEHLDDPRSPHCRMNRPGGWDEFAAYSARMRNFAGPKEYGDWIAEDARNTLLKPASEQQGEQRESPLQVAKNAIREAYFKIRRCGSPLTSAK